jgi:hypothetical protein
LDIDYESQSQIMSCTQHEYVFSAAIAVFILMAGFATWWSSSLMAILKIRFPAIFSRMGRPRPVKTAESDSTNARVLLFLLSNEHESLADAQLTGTLYKIRLCCVVELIAVVTVLWCLALAPNAKEVMAFGCWLS